MVNTTLSATRRSSSLKKMLGGLSIGQIPIGGSKRRSFAMTMNGQSYRIGNIAANMAFMVVVGNLRLLYVSPFYDNYGYAARVVFGKNIKNVDFDHALSRKIAKSYNFQYVLLAKVDSSVNRSHGKIEKDHQYKGIVLDKFCYVDDRILSKLIGLKIGQLITGSNVNGYKVTKANQRDISIGNMIALRKALSATNRSLRKCRMHPISQ